MGRALRTERPPHGEAALREARWQLAQRVASSAAFRKSRRLREFLLFVCERALHDPSAVVREQELGTVVFGRPADFDTSQDTLVRVHASQLRKRLQQYFATEGAAEPVLIEIPKGTYMPVFRERAPEPAPPADATAVAAADPPSAAPVHAEAQQQQQQPARAGARTLAAAAAAGLALLACLGWLVAENRELRRRLSAGLTPRPVVDRLWRQMFGNGQHTYVVLADSNLTMFQDLIQYQVPPPEYQRQQFNEIAGARLQDPLTRGFARALMSRQFTSIADASLARRIGVLNAAHGIPTDIILARDAGPRHFRGHNAVLSGSRRSNPWVELFEHRLNFRSRFEESPRSSHFENVAPRPGEEPRYVVSWDRLGYCRVAFLPNLDATGSVLIISGTEMASSDAGVEFITSEPWVERLRATLGVSGGQPLPYFEALLRARLVISASPSFELIAHRVIKP